MNLTEKAEQRLKKLLPKEAVGFSVTGFVGTCRGSTPVIQPAQEAQPGQETLAQSGLTFFLNPEIAERFGTCSLDYDRSFLGKGLTATWAQCEECACHS
jgi:Fe-S cluster assembly iron-binding protein IscA